MSSKDSRSDVTADSKTKDKVHSANSWETADLGDESRNKKFLKLMGASKKEHHGRFVIGDQKVSHTHKRERDQEKHLEEELTEQYEQGMEHRLAGGRRGHIGLGFHGDDDSEDKEKKDDKEKHTTDTEEDKGNQEEETQNETETKDEQEKTVTGSESDQAKDTVSEKDEQRKRMSEQNDSDNDVKKIKFVKSSS